MRLKNLIIGVVAGFALAAGLWVAFATMQKPPAKVTTATTLPVALQLPAFELLDHAGRPVDQRIFEGQWDLVFFGFTHCPDICPLTLKILETARARLQQDGIVPLPRIVLVSVDPERDTPARLSSYIHAFGDNNLGLTGELEELRKLTGAIGIFFDKRTVDGEQYSVDHSSVVVVVDPEGRFHSLFGSPHNADAFVHDLPILMGI